MLITCNVEHAGNSGLGYPMALEMEDCSDMTSIPAEEVCAERTSWTQVTQDKFSPISTVVTPLFGFELDPLLFHGFCHYLVTKQINTQVRKELRE